jgi:succinyl-diaminopimelate desuccinylase
MPNLGVNAIQKLSKVLSAIGEFKMSYSPHPLLSGPTINIGTIKGGIAPNVVAGEAEAILDIRYLPSQTPEGIMRELSTFIEGLRKQDPRIDVVVEKVSSQIPTEVSPDDGFVKIVSGAIRSVLGKKPKLVGIGGATVAKSYLSYGIPALMYGPGDDRIDHVANEYIELDQVITAAKVMALSALDLLK